MFCRNCGSQIDDNAYICVHCGAATGQGAYFQKAPVDPDEPANGGFVALSILIPMFGIIYGAVEKSNGKLRAGKSYLTCGIASMIAWVVIPIVLSFFIFLLATVLSLLPLIPLIFSSM